MLNKKCDFISIKLGIDYMFGVDCVSRSRGLLLLWKADFNVDIHNFSCRHINIVVGSSGWVSNENSSAFMATRKQQGEKKLGPYSGI